MFERVNKKYVVWDVVNVIVFWWFLIREDEVKFFGEIFLN